MKRTRNQYKIVTYPSKKLRVKTIKVKIVDDNIKEILSTMVYTMHKNSGIGLAATQVGLNLRLAVVDAGDGLLKMVNPVIMQKTGTDSMDEGCLSLPSILVKVKRAKSIVVEYLDEHGRKVQKMFNGLSAKAIQHEVDHLNGKLIIDYLPWFKRLFLLNA